MRQIRRYICTNGHGFVWEGDTEPTMVGDVGIVMGFPERCHHLLSLFPSMSCGEKMKLVRIESPYEQKQEQQ